MKHLIRSLFLTLAFGVSAASAAPDADCHRDVCVGDRAINVTRDYREVTVVGIDNFGKFVLRFEDTGGVGGNWDREDLALMRGCFGDLCVGYPAYNISRDYRHVKVHAIQWNGRFVLRFDDTGGVGGNWDRWDLAVAWGCVGDLCVNDVVYNRANGREATIAAIQMTQNGIPSLMVLRFNDNGGVGGNWGMLDLVLLRRGPTAYPPGGLPPQPTPPYCPPGTHWDPRLGRCVANPPPPPPPMTWECRIAKPGRIFIGRGPTRQAATQAALTGCARAGGYVCRATEVVCRY